MERRQFLKSPVGYATSILLPGMVFSPRALAAVVDNYPAAPNYSVDKYLKVRAALAGDSVTLQVEGSDLGGNPYTLSDRTLRLRLLAERPDTTQIELAVVSYPYTATVSRNLLSAGGWVCLTGEVLIGTVNHKFHVNPLYLGTGVSKVPVPPVRVLSAQYDSGRPDWLAAPARYASTMLPYVMKSIPSQNGVAPTQWVKEVPWGPGQCYPESTPRWRRIGGQIQVDRYREHAAASGAVIGPIVNARLDFPTYGGPPDVANLFAYATVRGHPSGGRGPMWIELDGFGRFWGYNRDGTVTAMAGFRMPADPYEIPNETLNTWHTVGQFPDGPLKHPHDFAYDFVDRKYLYVADTDNNRLVRVSRHAAVVTGQPEDFSKWVLSAWGAAFVKPTSVESTVDGKIYVVDGQGLWSVNRTSGAKTQVIAGTNLFWVRALSSGLVCVSNTVGQIFRVDPASRQSTLLATATYNGNVIASEWPVMSVDLTGQIGPRDSLYYVTTSNYFVWRFDQDGTVAGPVYIPTNGGSAVLGDARYCQDTPGHYIWNAEVHQEEPYLFCRGFANSTPALIRPMQADESHLSQYDRNSSHRARMIMQRGTIEGFPWGARASLSSLMTTHGHSGLGVKMFDEIQAMPLADRIAYVKSGMGGSVARPELVGDHLRALLYWIWRNSRQFLQGRPADIPEPQTDTTAPAITNVRVTRSGDRLTWTFRTDRPALCYVRFADRVPMYRWTPLENTFTAEHTAVGVHASHAVSYQICALGLNGVLAEGAIATVGASTDTTPPKAPTGLR
jgi:hypothetical protein